MHFKNQYSQQPVKLVLFLIPGQTAAESLQSLPHALVAWLGQIMTEVLPAKLLNSRSQCK